MPRKKVVEESTVVNNEVDDSEIDNNEIDNNEISIDNVEEENVLPDLNIEILTQDEINNSQHGIAYVTSGKVKEHISKLAAVQDAIINLPSGLSDEQFKTYVTIEINNMKRDIQELVDGANTLYKLIKGE
jgi:hypothetical protein